MFVVLEYVPITKGLQKLAFGVCTLPGIILKMIPDSGAYLGSRNGETKF